MNTAIVEFNEFEANLTEFKARYEGIVYDFGKAAQEKQAKADRLAIGKIIAALDRTHKTIKAPLKAKSDLLDGERKRIKDGLLSVQGDIKSQITQHEEQLQAVEDALASRVGAIKDMTFFETHPDSIAIVARMSLLEKITVDDSFAHHEANAALAHLNATKMLKGMLTEITAHEEQLAENQRLKAELAKKEQAERDARIAREARATAEEARAAAEREALAAKARAAQAEADAAADAAAAAERERLAGIRAEEAAAEAAKEARIEQAAAVCKAQEDADREQRRVAEIVAQDKAAREADMQHKGKFNREAAIAFQEMVGGSIEGAQEIVRAIAQGNIPNVTINY